MAPRWTLFRWFLCRTSACRLADTRYWWQLLWQTCPVRRWLRSAFRCLVLSFRSKNWKYSYCLLDPVVPILSRKRERKKNENEKLMQSLESSRTKNEIVKFLGTRNVIKVTKFTTLWTCGLVLNLRKKTVFFVDIEKRPVFVLSGCGSLVSFFASEFYETYDSWMKLTDRIQHDGALTQQRTTNNEIIVLFRSVAKWKKRSGYFDFFNFVEHFISLITCYVGHMNLMGLKPTGFLFFLLSLSYQSTTGDEFDFERLCIRFSHCELTWLAATVE